MKKIHILMYCILFTLLAGGSFLWASPSAETRGIGGIGIVAIDPNSGAQREVKLYNKSYAVIIGIDQYINLPFDQQLSYAVKDAKGVEDVLKRHFKFDKIISLYNSAASKANIMKILSGDLSQLSEEDSVFIFWAGHGFTEKTAYGDLGYLLPFDGTFNQAELYKNISMTTLKDDISKRIPSKHVFYVMDSCYSGLLVATRGGNERKTSRNLKYLQEITKEKVRQVLTAGSKDQEVLDGGPMGHSVFTGRLIEALENTEDYITATELSSLVKEKVYSDANVRGHIQTPKYGELFGLGDYVFVPSIERKVEDAQEQLLKLQVEQKRLEELEKAAIAAKDEQAQRNAELQKRVLGAKLKAEEIRQQQLAEEQKKREQQAAEQQAAQEALVRQKKDEDQRLAALRKQVEEKRESLGGTTLSSLSPEKTLGDARQVDAKIKEIRVQFRDELKKGILAIVDRYNVSFLKLAGEKKDEFETQKEFESRIQKKMGELNSGQANEFTAFQDKAEKEYKAQIVPFLEQLHKLSTNEFTLTADKLILALGNYNAKFNTYPITIRTKEPIKGILVAANANVPIPRMEAREFKQHFENNMLRPEIKGSFPNPEVFQISQAYVIDDATAKKYDLFAARFVDLGNGTLFDTESKLIWARKVAAEGKKMGWYGAQNYIKRMNEIGQLGFKDWRMPSLAEMNTLLSYASSKGYNKASLAEFLNKFGFEGVQNRNYWTSTISKPGAYAKKGDPYHLEFYNSNSWKFANGYDYSGSNGYVFLVRAGR